MAPIIRAPRLTAERHQLQRTVRSAPHRETKASVPETAATRSPLVAPKAPAPEEKAQVPQSHAREMKVDREANREADREAAMEAELAMLRQRAEAEGYAAGMKRAFAAQEQMVAEFRTQLAGVLQALSGAGEAVRAEAEELAMEMTFAAIGRILGEKLASASGVAAAVGNALLECASAEPVSLRLHPHDHLLLQEHANDLLAAYPGLAIRADDSLETGGCIVETTRGLLDARIDVQLDALRRALLSARRLKDAGSAA